MFKKTKQHWVVLRILIISECYTVITQGTTHLGILPWITGIIGLPESHFDVNNIRNFTVILHWSSTAKFCPKKQLENEHLKLEMWSISFTLSEKLRCMKDTTLLKLILFLARGNFCPLHIGKNEHVNWYTYTCTLITFDGQCWLKLLHYYFPLCFKLTLQGKLFIKTMFIRLVDNWTSVEWLLCRNCSSFLCHSLWPSTHWFGNLLF